MGVKGCWTCRERKVKCDLLKPHCGNCTKAKRECKGYGIQLSWPGDNDRRRAMVLSDKHDRVNDSGRKARKFVNSSPWDVSLAEALASGASIATYLRGMHVPSPTYLSPLVINEGQSELLEFFNESRSLVLGPTDEEILSRFILRVAFSAPSDATNPVLQGIFALASLQLDASLKSIRYKHVVMSLVAESANWLDEKALLQNLVATMLLYHFELSLEPSSRSDWVIYLCAVKKIINTSPTFHKLIREEYSVFLDWIYYHEVLAEFTIRHWKVPYEGCGFAPIARSPRITQSIGCPIDVLQLVAISCRQAIVTISVGTEDLAAEAEGTWLLEQRMHGAVENYDAFYEQIEPTADRNALVSILHQLASLIYTNRAVHRVSGTDFRHRRLVREALLLLDKLETCQSAWPLFIIACEAVDDESRITVLDVFDRSLKDRRRRSSHIHFIQRLVEAVWNQRDLSTEDQIDYMTMFDAVIGGVPFVPPFA